MSLLPVTNKQIQHGIDKIIDAYNSVDNWESRKVLKSWGDVILAQCYKNNISPNTLFEAMWESNDRIFADSVKELRRKNNDFKTNLGSA